MGSSITRKFDLVTVDKSIISTLGSKVQQGKKGRRGEGFSKLC